MVSGGKLISQKADTIQIDALAGDDFFLAQGAFDFKAELFDHAKDGGVIGSDVGADFD